MNEEMARRILEAAIAEGRCGELLGALFDGGAATVDASGALVIATAEQLPRVTGIIESNDSNPLVLLEDGWHRRSEVEGR